METKFKKVERMSDDIMVALANAPIFKKQGTVKARPAQPGEKIITKLASGAEETTNTAGESDWVVTNPSGEEYLISEEKFLSRYEATGEDGVYAAKGYCRAIKNPFGVPVEIMASWGEPQTGSEDCFFADVCDVDGKMDGQPYLIDGDAFAETYAQV